jgi:hypothetical protein
MGRENESAAGQGQWGSKNFLDSSNASGISGRGEGSAGGGRAAGRLPKKPL